MTIRALSAVRCICGCSIDRHDEDGCLDCCGPRGCWGYERRAD